MTCIDFHSNKPAKVGVTSLKLSITIQADFLPLPTKMDTLSHLVIANQKGSALQMSSDSAFA